MNAPLSVYTPHDDNFIFDCVVIGSGHAGSCAAFAAKDAGCTRVIIVDKCPEAWAGGNGYFTAGAFRTAHAGFTDLLPLLKDASPNFQLASTNLSAIDIEPYSAKEFAEDIQRLASGRSNPDLVTAVVEHSRDTLRWLSDKIKIPFVLSYNRQAYEVNGRMKFWGGMALSVEDGGKGLIKAHHKTLKEAGVQVWFEAQAVEILTETKSEDEVNCSNSAEVCGIVIDVSGERKRLATLSVILAAGGFEANEDMRVRYLGDSWVNARVRGTPYNTGDGYKLAQSIGARETGDWEGCHSTAWDADAPLHGGDRELTNQYTKSGYPLGIMINAKGARFVDEGEDFRNYTYAKFGQAILHQPGGYAFQLWDAKVLNRLRKEEYADTVVKKAWAQTIEGLADLLSIGEWGLGDRNQFIKTIQEFNIAVREAEKKPNILEWNPAIKDGRTTQSEYVKLDVPKSNWALTIDKAPFMAVKVACGITFTFGGLSIDPNTANVISNSTSEPINGLFCAGEMVGGLFYGNYPGGSGLTAGAVFGRMAGESAARRRRLKVE